MGYLSLNGQCHNGKEGIHLATSTCPEGCFSCSDDNFVGDTIEEKQSSANACLETAPEGLSVTIISVNPLAYRRKYQP